MKNNFEGSIKYIVSDSGERGNKSLELFSFKNDFLRIDYMNEANIDHSFLITQNSIFDIFHSKKRIIQSIRSTNVKSENEFTSQIVRFTMKRVLGYWCRASIIQFKNKESFFERSKIYIVRKLKRSAPIL